MKIEIVQPEGWKKPKGYANGVVLSGQSKLVFAAGQVAWDKDEKLVGRGDFGAQFEQALRNVVSVLQAAGAQPAHIVRLTVYVTDKQMYVAHAKKIGVVWKDLVGKHYPAMSLVEVADLLEEGALVELEATAAIA
jgi:enamine deaminase RidA (YjgF/YER057c/UK114 family)